MLIKRAYTHRKGDDEPYNRRLRMRHRYWQADRAIRASVPSGDRYFLQEPTRWVDARGRRRMIIINKRGPFRNPAAESETEYKMIGPLTYP